jgi:hypothetical protein
MSCISESNSQQPEVNVSPHRLMPFPTEKKRSLGLRNGRFGGFFKSSARDLQFGCWGVELSQNVTDLSATRRDFNH